MDERDNSEVLGDTNYDNRIDELDQPRFMTAFGRSEGQPGYLKAADLDPPEGPNGVIDLVDWQRWLEAEEAARASEARCGLLGIEPLLLLAGVAAARRHRRRDRARRSRPLLGLLAAVALVAGSTWAPPASALVALSYDLAPGTVVDGGIVIVGVGESFQVDVVAELSEPIVGWGLDANTDGSKLLLDNVAIGPAWTGVGSADGDGLAGLTTLPGVSGDPVLIATLTFEGLTQGLTSVLLGATAGDNSEGFALATPGLFDSVVYPSGLQVQIVPEPASLGLLTLGLLGLATTRRRLTATRRRLTATRRPAHR